MTVNSIKLQGGQITEFNVKAPNKDLTDFMLEEYKNIAQAYFNSHDTTAKWVKFYLILMASPFSIILFVYKNDPSGFDYNNLPNLISSSILLIGFLSTHLSFIILNSRLDSTLYARTVNGIRRYFKDNYKKDFPNSDIEKYFVLGDNVNVPKFFKIGDITLLVLFMSVANSLFVGLGLSQISNIKRLYSYYISQNTMSILIFCLFATSHWVYCYNSANKKSKTYTKI
jgi:hypothetical protein